MVKQNKLQLSDFIIDTSVVSATIDLRDLTTLDRHPTSAIRSSLSFSDLLPEAVVCYQHIINLEGFTLLQVQGPL